MVVVSSLKRHNLLALRRHFERVRQQQTWAKATLLSSLHSHLERWAPFSTPHIMKTALVGTAWRESFGGADPAIFYLTARPNHKILAAMNTIHVFNEFSTAGRTATRSVIVRLDGTNLVIAVTHTNARSYQARWQPEHHRLTALSSKSEASESPRMR